MREDQTALITGGTDGIGKEIAHRLASEGVRVFIVGSNEEKGQRAEAELRKASKSDSVHFIRADLSLMQDTYRLAEEITAHIPKLHYLVLCAGIVRGERTVTPEGIETNFAVDYLTRKTHKKNSKAASVYCKFLLPNKLNLTKRTPLQ